MPPLSRVTALNPLHTATRLTKTMLVCLVCLALSGMTLATQATCQGLDTEVELTLGALPAADSLALYVAVDQGMFARHGLKVTVVPFQSALELGAAVRAKAVDGYFGDIMNVILLHESGVPQRIVATTSYTEPEEHGARFFGIVVPPSSKAQTLADVQHGTMAIGRATIVDFLLDRILQHQGLPLDHVERVDIRHISVRLQMVLAGQVAGAVLPEPLVSLVEAQGARVIADDRTLDMPLAVVALHEDKAKQKTVMNLQAALSEAMIAITADPETYRTVMLKRKLLPQGAAQKYTMVRFNPTYTPTPLPSPQAVQQVMDWMQSKGMLKRGTAPEALLGNSSS